MRSPDDVCLLCKSAKATKTGSHFIPQALLSSAIGKRNKEEAWTVDASAIKAKVHFGRENLKNTSPDITLNPHVMNYVFCPQCEEKLGGLEEKMLPVLNEKIRIEKYRQQLSVTTDGNLTVVTLEKLEGLPFFVFVTSLVWRMCLQETLNDGINILPDNLIEECRDSIYSFLYNLSMAENKLSSFINGYTVITYPIDSNEENKNVINPYNQVLNPDIYLVNEFTLLVHRTDVGKCDLKTFTSNTGLESSLLKEDYINNPDSQVKIVFVGKSAWENFRTIYLTREARRGIQNKLKGFFSWFC